MEIKSIRVHVYGRVTGVCFRLYAVEQSLLYPDLKGFIRNINASELESVIQGRSADVDRFADWFKMGPPGAVVNKICISELPLSESLGIYKIQY